MLNIKRVYGELGIVVSRYSITVMQRTESGLALEKYRIGGAHHGTSPLKERLEGGLWRLSQRTVLLQ